MRKIECKTQQGFCREHHLTSTNRMGSTTCICTPEKQNSPKFCRLPQAWRRTRRDSNSIPQIDDWISWQRKATVSSALNGSSSYWQIKVEYDDECKITVTLHHSLYHFVRTPFWLTQRPWHVPSCDRGNPINRPKGICNHFSRPHHDN